MDSSRHRTLGVMAWIAVTLLAASAAFAQFPPIGQDTFASASGFSVTVNTVTYSGLINDPMTTVGRSAVTTEGAGAVAVDITNCAACTSPVSDTDITCFPVPSGGPATLRELHTEMVSLDMCGTATATIPGTFTVCYLAGQPAATALATTPFGVYGNSYGEIESLDPTGNPTNDFPADSFWVMSGVVTIEPLNPAGPIETYFATAPILMSFGTVTALPPLGGNYANNLTGTTIEGGGGVPCGALPVALFDAGTGVNAGQINSSVVHNVLASNLIAIPTLTKWGLIVLTLLFLGLAMLSLRRNKARA